MMAARPNPICLGFRKVKTGPCPLRQVSRPGFGSEWWYAAQAGVSGWLGMVVCRYVAASLGVVDSVGVCEVKGTDNRVDDPAGRSGGLSGGHDTWSGG